MNYKGAPVNYRGHKGAQRREPRVSLAFPVGGFVGVCCRGVTVSSHFAHQSLKMKRATSIDLLISLENR